MTLAAPPLALINMSRLASPDGSSGHINMMLPCPSANQPVEVVPVSSRSYTLLLLMQDSSRTRLDSTPSHLSVCSTTDDFCSCDTPGHSIFACPPPVISPMQTTLPPALMSSSLSSLTLPSASVFPPPTDSAAWSESYFLPSPSLLRSSEGFSYNVDTEWMDHRDDKPPAAHSALFVNDLANIRPSTPVETLGSMPSQVFPPLYSTGPVKLLCLDGLSLETSVPMLTTGTCGERAVTCC